MKILHTVEQYYPSIGGMQEVVKQLSERLVKLGHEVTVATSCRVDRKYYNLNGVQVKSFKISGNAVRGYEGKVNEIKRYQNFLINSDFDIITNFAAQQWATDLALKILKKIKAKKVFVPTGFSGLYYPCYKEYFVKMIDWMKQYDMNVFLSSNYRDINFARDHNISKLVIIPNGAGADEFLSKIDFDIRKLFNIKLNDFIVLLVGSHTGKKGHKEAIKIFQVANLKNSTLIIVANIYSINCYLSCKLKSF
ncbi:MAG: glycosyltransferase family 4 protein, partial [Patescibacteria group bacterium]